MDPKTRTAEIFVVSKPVNFYVYSTLFMFGVLGLGVVYSYLENGGFEGKVVRIVLPCLGVLVLSYYIRFWFARNLESLRERIIASESEEDAFSLVTGGVTWGIGTLAVLSITFYLSIRPYL